MSTSPYELREQRLNDRIEATLARIGRTLPLVFLGLSALAMILVGALGTETSISIGLGLLLLCGCIIVHRQCRIEDVLLRIEESLKSQPEHGIR